MSIEETVKPRFMSKREEIISWKPYYDSMLIDHPTLGWKTFGADKKMAKRFASAGNAHSKKNGLMFKFVIRTTKNRSRHGEVVVFKTIKTAEERALANTRAKMLMEVFNKVA